MRFEENDFEELSCCPWCFSGKYDKWCNDDGGFFTAECSSCNLIFVQKRLNALGREKYYKEYYKNPYRFEESRRREEMYKIDHNFITSYVDHGKVLDIGCSGGEFLSVFDAGKWDRWGIEFGESAAEAAKKNIGDQVFLGRLDKCQPILDQKFDLIIFRGVIEHVDDPKKYLTAATDLLNNGGKIFIGSTPNSNSICARLFRNMWNQHCPESHIFHFSPEHFSLFFKQNGCQVLDTKYFYLETPYVNLNEDLETIRMAADCAMAGRKINFKSPPFFDNLITMIAGKK